jgi:hypothetical protein
VEVELVEGVAPPPHRDVVLFEESGDATAVPTTLHRYIKRDVVKAKEANYPFTSHTSATLIGMRISPAGMK